MVTSDVAAKDMHASSAQAAGAQLCQLHAVRLLVIVIVFVHACRRLCLCLCLCCACTAVSGTSSITASVTHGQARAWFPAMGHRLATPIALFKLILLCTKETLLIHASPVAQEHAGRVTSCPSIREPVDANVYMYVDGGVAWSHGRHRRRVSDLQPSSVRPADRARSINSRSLAKALFSSKFFKK